MEVDGYASVNHKRKEYVRWTGAGETVTINTMEGHFSIQKRRVHGICHQISNRHPCRYLSEFDLRYNARDITGRERGQLVVEGTDEMRFMLGTHCRGPKADKEAVMGSQLDRDSVAASIGGPTQDASGSLVVYHEEAANDQGSL